MARSTNQHSAAPHHANHFNQQQQQQQQQRMDGGTTTLCGTKTSQMWLDAIDHAAECLRNGSHWHHNHNNEESRSNSDDHNDSAILPLENSLKYLVRLENILLKECTKKPSRNENNIGNKDTNENHPTDANGSLESTTNASMVPSGSVVVLAESSSSNVVAQQQQQQQPTKILSSTRDDKRWSEVPNHPPPNYDKFMQKQHGQRYNRNNRRSQQQPRANTTNDNSNNNNNNTNNTAPTNNNNDHSNKYNNNTNNGNRSNNRNNSNRNGRNRNNNNNGLQPGHTNYNPYARAFANDIDDDDDHDDDADGDVEAVDGGGFVGSNNNNNGDRSIMHNSTPFTSNNIDDSDAGDMPVLNHHHSGEYLSNSQKQADDDDASIMFMDRRRLLIRILTCQGDFYSTLSVLYAMKRNRQWYMGAKHCSNALERINKALMLADTEISFMMATSLSNYSYDDMIIHNRKVKAYQYDAEIVVITLDGLTKLRDKYLQLAQHQYNIIENKLRPQYESRDEVKQRMGLDRWKNNPSPRNYYVKLRQQLEIELRDLQSAFAITVNNPDNDFQIVMEKSLKMKQRLESYTLKIRHTILTMSNQHNNNNNRDVAASTTTTSSTPNLIPTTLTYEQILMERYSNNIRLTYQAPRVSTNYFLDPTLYGWILTGTGMKSSSTLNENSHNNSELLEPVEYYEKEDNTILSNTKYDHLKITNNTDYYIEPRILFDWYYTTATMTIQIVLYHYYRGQQEGKDSNNNKTNCIVKSQILIDHIVVTHKQYENILQNPLSSLS